MKRIPCLLAAILSLLLLVSCGRSVQESPQNETSSTSKPDSSQGASQADNSSASTSNTPLYQLLIDTALQANKFDDSISYDDLARSPAPEESESYSYEYVQFTGQIVQVIEGDGFTAYRFAVDNDYDQIIYVESYPEYATDILIENDHATLSGVTVGQYSYETVVGNMVTIPAVIAAKFEATELVLPEYPAGPLTLEERLSSGRLYSTTEVESFTITDAEISYSGDLHITCQVSGIVSGSEYLSLALKCYDKDGILIKTTNILASVGDGERFRISDDTYIPTDTSRIELAVN